jgi:hypothetical protein
LAYGSILLFFLASASRTAFADFITWYSVGGAGDWFDAANWGDLNRVDGDGNPLNVVPGAADRAYLNGTGTLAQIAGPGVAQASYIQIELNASIRLSNGSLIDDGMGVGEAGFGSFIQTGGTHTISGDLKLGVLSGYVDGSTGHVYANSGSYGLFNGTLSVTNEFVGYLGGTGTFNQTGGTHTVSAELAVSDEYYPHSGGTFDLQGGSVTAGALMVSPGGTFTNSATLSLAPTANFMIVNTPGGTFTQGSKGTLNIQINRNIPGNGLYGQLKTGSANLGGTLNVVLNNDFSAILLPYNTARYRVITSIAPVTTKFSKGVYDGHGKQVLEATFLSGAKAGLFDVDYNVGNNGVSLTNFHQIHTACVGVTDSGVPDYGISISGDSAASAVDAALSKLPGVIDHQLLRLTAGYGQNNSANVGALHTFINNITVQPGDTFIFYVNAHAGTGTPPWDHPIAGVLGPTQLSLTSSVSNPGETVDAATFASWFSGTKWQEVNKLFLMDTCHAYGFWQGQDPAKTYLSALPHCAIIAASTEAALSSWHTYSDGYVGGELGHAVIGALGQVSGVFDFGDFLSEVQRQGQFVPSDNGFVQGTSEYVYGAPLLEPLPVVIIGASSSDFQLNAVSSVPEPSVLSLLAMGGAGLLRICGRATLRSKR